MVGAQVEVQVLLKGVEKDEGVHLALGDGLGVADALVVGVRPGEVHAVPPVGVGELLGKGLQNVGLQGLVLLPQEKVKPGPPHVVCGDSVVVPQHVRAVAQQPGGVHQPGKTPV